MTPEAAFDQYSSAVYRFAYRMTRREDLAEDVAIGTARLARPAAAPGVVVKTERVEVPVIQERVVTRTVYRDRVVATAAAWRPVSELRPRIIRRGEGQ